MNIKPLFTLLMLLSPVLKAQTVSQNFDNKSTGKCVYHLGSWGGYDTFISRFIDNGQTIIVLPNTTNHNKVDAPMKLISIYCLPNPLNCQT